MAGNETFRDALLAFKDGKLSLQEAEKIIRGLQVEFVGDFARIDLGRTVRCGMPEVVLAEGKTPVQLLDIMKRFLESSGRCIATRANSEHVDMVRNYCTQTGAECRYNPMARTLVLSNSENREKHGGRVGIITAGTSDITVAEEAREIAEEMGCIVRTAYDVGAAGIHRLFPAIRDLADVDVFIVAAGREGTLPAVVAGLVDRPVIGVPVSTGYGYMGRGEAALASMLQSCAVLTVVNIDAGFTAGAFAARIAELVAKHE